jgi:hypothetical protein
MAPAAPGNVDDAVGTGRMYVLFQRGPLMDPV